MKPLLAALFLLAACATEPTAVDPGGDPIDGEDEAFDVGKSDGGCPPTADSDDTRGVLALANDPAATAEQLDALGLSSRAANGIVEARPFANLAELDAVPWVGPYSCRALQREACNERGLCERVLPVWTWNIEHFPLTGGAIDAVAGVLGGGDRAELVGFQEVDSLTAFDQLLAKLPGWEGLPGQTGFDTQVALAYRTDRLEVVATEDLFPTNSYQFPRPPLAVTFEVKGRTGTRRVVLVVVHLKAMVDAASRERRRQAIVTLEGWLAAKRATGDAVIVLGDWNDVIDATGADNVFAPLLAKPDAYSALTLDVAQRNEYSYIPYRKLIDHVVVTHETVDQFPLLTIDPVKLDETMPGYKDTISDHRPIEARLLPIVPRS